MPDDKPASLKLVTFKPFEEVTLKDSKFTVASIDQGYITLKLAEKNAMCHADTSAEPVSQDKENV